MPHPLRQYLTTVAGMIRGGVPKHFSPPVASTARWSAERARAWYEETGWLLGCNFVPSTAGSQLEMWQPETWDAETIDRELGWAARLGMNSVRVFLHDLLWSSEGDVFLDRVDEYLQLADAHGISTMFVLFDGVWDPDPKLGPQREPTPNVHNSIWVQGPGRTILADRSRWPELRPYVEAVLHRFGADSRVVAWDLFNEPDQANAISYPRQELPGKTALTDELLGKLFDWAIEVDPIQPLTAGVFLGVTGAVERVSQLNRTMLGRSDVISFHSYAPRDKLLDTIDHLARYERPILCTEWMARSVGSPVSLVHDLAEHDVSAWSWGLVDGRSQTRFSWTSWFRQPKANATWFHDLLYRDGRPYDPDEEISLREASARKRCAPPKG